MVLPLQWNVDDGYDADITARVLSFTTDIWTDGSVVKDAVSLDRAAGAGMFFTHTFLRFGLIDVVGARISLVVVSASCSVLFPDSCNLSKDLNCGSFFWHFKHVHLFILMETISMSSDMSDVCLRVQMNLGGIYFSCEGGVKLSHCLGHVVPGNAMLPEKPLCHRAT